MEMQIGQGGGGRCPPLTLDRLAGGSRARRRGSQLGCTDRLVADEDEAVAGAVSLQCGGIGDDEASPDGAVALV
jgi:hypothetical protein